MSEGSFPKTVGELKGKNYKVLSVKDEIRKNLLWKPKNKEELFTGITGYDKTVVPAVKMFKKSYKYRRNRLLQQYCEIV